MPASSALHAYTTTLSLDPAGGTSYVAIVEVTEVSGLDISVTNTKVTNLASPNRSQEFKPGLIDFGNVTFTINATKAQVNTFRSNLGVAAMTWKLQWPLFGAEITASNWTFAGHIDKFTTKYPDDDRITCDLSVKVTGAGTFTQGS